MDLVIDDSESFEGQDTFNYRLIFHSINKKQREYLISHFQNYSWEEGLSIPSCLVDEMPRVSFFQSFLNNEADIEFKFISTKRYENKDWSDWSASDLDEILDTKLVGRGQFFSNIWYSDQDLDEKKITLFDQHNIEYEVELSKDSSIHKK